MFESMISRRPLSDECPAPRTLMPAPEENETVAAFIKGRGDPDADKAPEKMDTEGPAAQTDTDQIERMFVSYRDRRQDSRDEGRMRIRKIFGWFLQAIATLG